MSYAKSVGFVPRNPPCPIGFVSLHRPQVRLGSFRAAIGFVLAARRDRLGSIRSIAARIAVDNDVRDDAYRKMTAIFLEHTPWIVVLQPYEEYGLRRYVEFTPSPDQQLELRRFNFRIRRT